MFQQRLKQATEENDRPTPFYLYHLLIQFIESDTSLITISISHFKNLLVSDTPYSRLKSLLCIKHIAVRSREFKKEAKEYLFDVISSCTTCLEFSHLINLLISDNAVQVLAILDSDSISQVDKARIYGLGSTAYFNNVNPEEQKNVAIGLVKEVLGAVSEVTSDLHQKGAALTIKDSVVDVFDIISEGLVGLSDFYKNYGGRTLDSSTSSSFLSWNRLVIESEKIPAFEQVDLLSQETDFYETKKDENKTGNL